MGVAGGEKSATVNERARAWVQYVTNVCVGTAVRLELWLSSAAKRHPSPSRTGARGTLRVSLCLLPPAAATSND
jgi:hypothetical protein